MTTGAELVYHQPSNQVSDASQLPTRAHVIAYCLSPSAPASIPFLCPIQPAPMPPPHLHPAWVLQRRRRDGVQAWLQRPQHARQLLGAQAHTFGQEVAQHIGDVAQGQVSLLVRGAAVLQAGQGGHRGLGGMEGRRVAQRLAYSLVRQGEKHTEVKLTWTGVTFGE